MPINAELVMKMVEPYVRDNSITYWEFENLFEMLSKPEQYEVINVLISNNIDLLDNIPQSDLAEESDEVITYNLSDEEPTEEFEIKYKNVFEDSALGEEYEFQYKNIRQTNELLCHLIQQGNRQAKSDLCNKNQGLVQKYAGLYEKACGYSIEYKDLMQVGYIGLLKAAEKFDASKECAFSTYAVWWLKQAMTREIADSGNTIRIPVHMIENIKKASRIDRELSISEPDFYKRLYLIAKEMNRDLEQIMDYFAIRNCMMTTVSLDVPIGEDKDTPLWQFLPDEGSKTTEEVYEEKELSDLLEDLLECLKPREREIIKMRFGLEQTGPMTLEEIGQKYNVSRERIRQIEAKALRKLKNPKRRRLLDPYWFD